MLSCPATVAEVCVGDDPGTWSASAKPFHCSRNRRWFRSLRRSRRRCMLARVSTDVRFLEPPSAPCEGPVGFDGLAISVP